MLLSKSNPIKYSMSGLVLSLCITSVVSNGFVLAILARFKKLRTVPNILLANLALVDLLNALINMPIYLAFLVLEATWIRGKTVAILTSSLQLEFVTLNLVSMLVMMMDRYFAISFEFRYHVWKTNGKAVLAIAVVWLLSTAVTISFVAPSYNINLGDVSLREYRRAMFNEKKIVLVAFLVFLALCAVILGIMTGHSLRGKKHQRAVLSQSPPQAQARLRREIRATKTVAITVVAFCACYVPIVLFAISGYKNEEGDMNGVWFGFLAAFSPFIGSAINPVIYALRTSRFRSALKQLIKDPCGTNDFQDKGDKREPEMRQRDDTIVRNCIRRMVRGRNRVGDMEQLEIVPSGGTDQLAAPLHH